VQLSALTGASPQLLDRLLRHLAAMSIINETGPSSFAQTPLSYALTIPHYRDLVPFCFTTAVLPIFSLPQYFAEKGYANPTNVLDGPFQFAHKTNLSAWGWGKEQEGLAELFNNQLAGYSMGKRRWMDESAYPVKERLLDGMEKSDEAVLLVDVGGGVGMDLSEFKSKFSDVGARLVLQEQISMIEIIKMMGRQPEGIDLIGHDFFKPQPIKGICDLTLLF